jgi:hypothetical protein
MGLYLRPERAHWFIQRGPWFAVWGAVLMALAIGVFRDIGFVSGLMLLLFGGCTLGLRAWLRERGLWMLAAVALCAWLPLYGAMQWDAIKRELNGPNPRLVWLGWDTALAASVVWLQVRLLATVVRVNRALPARVRRPEPDEGALVWVFP